MFGMVPNLVSGVILGLTTDVYSLYFAPVGMITGFMAGLAGSHCSLNKKNLFLPALAITVPGTVISSLICAVPVSYTHLDVYKRQIWVSPTNLVSRFFLR